MSKLVDAIHDKLQNQTAHILWDQGMNYTGQQIYRDTVSVQRILRQALGLNSNRVLLALPNSYAFVVCYLGSIQTGTTVVPIHPDLSISEMTKIAQQSHVQVAFIAEDANFFVRRQALAEVGVQKIFGVRLNSANPLCIDDQAIVHHASTNHKQHKNFSSHSSHTLYTSEETTAVFMFTSGTTGQAKGVPLSHRQIYHAACQVMDSHQLCAKDVAYCFLPLSHINAQIILLISTLLSGGKIILQEKFSASRFWQMVDEHNVTWVSAVPTVLAILLRTNDPVVIPTSLRFLRSASAPLSPLHQRQCEQRFKVPVIQGYGMTEAAGQICVNPLPPGHRKPNSVGVPQGLNLKILNDEKEPCAPGVTGEIVIQGVSVIQHYETDAKTNAKQFHNGWLLTGDIGYLDTDGYLFITGRKKEMINRGGEKISPTEIEEVLCRHPMVEKAAVLGLPDPMYGERIEAFVEKSFDFLGDSTCLKEELFQLCAQSLAVYKQPVNIHLMHELPSSSTGKVQRQRLRDALHKDGFIHIAGDDFTKRSEQHALSSISTYPLAGNGDPLHHRYNLRHLPVEKQTTRS